MKRLVLAFFLTGLLVEALTGCGENRMKDPRDGKRYKTVKIGDQTWMAENLNYKTEYSRCYNDEEANCTKYGRLYVWFDAMKACPSGWHLPSKEEFNMLHKAAGEVRINGKKRVLHDSGMRLKSTSGWKKNGNGDDTYSFSVLPAGFMRIDLDDESASFLKKGSYAYFWTSTEYSEFCANYIFFSYKSAEMTLAHFSKFDGFSVRCLKD